MALQHKHRRQTLVMLWFFQVPPPRDESEDEAEDTEVEDEVDNKPHTASTVSSKKEPSQQPPKLSLLLRGPNMPGKMLILML